MYKARRKYGKCPQFFSIETYRRMLSAFEPMRRNLMSGCLTLSNLTAILNEKYILKIGELPNNRYLSGVWS